MMRKKKRKMKARIPRLKPVSFHQQDPNQFPPQLLILDSLVLLHRQLLLL
jgi:hypothetical protein